MVYSEYEIIGSHLKRYFSPVELKMVHKILCGSQIINQLCRVWPTFWKWFYVYVLKKTKENWTLKCKEWLSLDNKRQMTFWKLL